MENILVTGGCGFIGSNFVRLALTELPGSRIVNLDHLTYAGNPENLADVENDPRYRFVKGDICDAELVNRIFAEERIDTVVHFAAESHVDRSIEGPAEFIHTNILGTFTLLEAARQAWQPVRRDDVTRNAENPTCHASRVTHHASRITRHASRVTEFSLPPRLHRRGLRLPGRQGLFHRRDPLRSPFPVLGE
jgi:dTDP-D-glucose 4,6-dehydratase